jgi:hypothetical protein
MKNNQQTILNLASDLRRISWWACDEKSSREALIESFLDLANKAKRTMEKENEKAAEIVERRIFRDWPKVKSDPKARLIWAEGVLTASLRLKHFFKSDKIGG